MREGEMREGERGKDEGERGGKMTEREGGR